MDNPISHDEVQNTFFDGETPKLWWKNSESEQILNRGYLLKGETVEEQLIVLLQQRQSVYINQNYKNLSKK